MCLHSASSQPLLFCLEERKKESRVCPPSSQAVLLNINVGPQGICHLTSPYYALFIPSYALLPIDNIC